jgi:hypothetical protein
LFSILSFRSRAPLYYVFETADCQVKAEEWF